MFPIKSNNIASSRLVVRASDDTADAAAATPTATSPAADTATKPKPPPIGPKRGAKVSHIQAELVIIFR